MYIHVYIYIKYIYGLCRLSSCVHDILLPINHCIVHRLVDAYSDSILCGCGSGCGLPGGRMCLLAVSVLWSVQRRVFSLAERLYHVDMYHTSPALHSRPPVRHEAIQSVYIHKYMCIAH